MLCPICGELATCILLCGHYWCFRCVERIERCPTCAGDVVNYDILDDEDFHKLVPAHARAESAPARLTRRQQHKQPSLTSASASDGLLISRSDLMLSEMCSVFHTQSTGCDGDVVTMETDTASIASSLSSVMVRVGGLAPFPSEAEHVGFPLGEVRLTHLLMLPRRSNLRAEFFHDEFCNWKCWYPHCRKGFVCDWCHHTDHGPRRHVRGRRGPR